VTFDSFLSEWEFWDTDGNVCSLETKDFMTFSISDYDDGYNCPSEWISAAITMAGVDGNS
jgi:hypothetical protein